MALTPVAVTGMILLSQTCNLCFVDQGRQWESNSEESIHHKFDFLKFFDFFDVLLSHLKQLEGFTEDLLPTHGVQLSHLIPNHTNWDRRWAITIANPPLGSLLQYPNIKRTSLHRSNTGRLRVGPDSQIPFFPTSVPKECITFPSRRQCHDVQWPKYQGVPKLSFEHSLAALNCMQMLGSLNNTMWPGMKTLERQETSSYHWPTTRPTVLQSCQSHFHSIRVPAEAEPCQHWRLDWLKRGALRVLHQIEDAIDPLGMERSERSESRVQSKIQKQIIVLRALEKVSLSGRHLISLSFLTPKGSMMQYGMLDVHSIDKYR